MPGAGVFTMLIIYSVLTVLYSIFPDLTNQLLGVIGFEPFSPQEATDFFNIIGEMINDLFNDLTLTLKEFNLDDILNYIKAVFETIMCFACFFIIKWYNFNSSSYFHDFIICLFHFVSPSSSGYIVTTNPFVPIAASECGARVASHGPFPIFYAA